MLYPIAEHEKQVEPSARHGELRTGFASFQLSESNCQILSNCVCVLNYLFGVSRHSVFWLFIFKVTEPNSIPYRTHSACAKRAAYPDPPPVIPLPDTGVAEVTCSDWGGMWKSVLFPLRTMGFPQELETMRFNLEPKRYKSVSLSAKRSVLTLVSPFTTRAQSSKL